MLEQSITSSNFKAVSQMNWSISMKQQFHDFDIHVTACCFGKFFVWDTRFFEGIAVLKGCYICIHTMDSIVFVGQFFTVLFVCLLFCFVPDVRCVLQFRESFLPVHNRVLLFYLFVLFCFVPGCFVQDWCVLQFRGDVKVARVAVATLILSFRGRTMNKCIERGKLKVNKPINNVGPVSSENE